MKLLLSVGAFLMAGLCASAQQSESNNEARSDARIGNMRQSQFMAINAKGAQMVSAIKPSSRRLSAADKQLFTKVALGGMRQLAISEAVLASATDEDVRMLAQSEVEEQTGVKAKLEEIAQAKGLTLPSEPDAMTKTLVSRVQGLSADEVNAFYIRESGVKGHLLLQSTMTTVRSKAKDDTMKSLAAATLPVIKTHLNVSQQIERGNKSKGSARSSR
jgi:putative membrane protein